MLGVLRDGYNNTTKVYLPKDPGMWVVALEYAVHDTPVNAGVGAFERNTKRLANGA